MALSERAPAPLLPPFGVTGGSVLDPLAVPTLTVPVATPPPLGRRRPSPWSLLWRAVDRVPGWVWRTAALFLLTRYVVLLGAMAVVLLDPRDAPVHAQRWLDLGDLPRLATNPAAALTVVDLVLGLALVLLLRRLFADLVDARCADRGVVLFAVWPVTAVLSTASTRPLLLLAAVGCLFLLGRRRWLGAGSLGAVAAAGGPTGMAVVAACTVAAVVAVRGTRRFSPLLAPLLAVTGVSVFRAAGWSTVSTVGGGGLLAGVRGPADVALVFLAVGVAVAGLAGLWRLRAHLNPAVVAFTVGVLVTGVVDSDSATDLAALAPTAFPLFLGLAVWVRHRWTVPTAVTAAVGVFAGTALLMSGILAR